jgi:glucose/arabinose dehydrogenase
MRADTKSWAGLAIGLLLSAGCSAPIEGSGHTSDDDQAPTAQTPIGVPEGFAASVFAEGLSGVRMLKWGPDEALYAVRSSAGELVRFEVNADGSANGEPTIVTTGLRQPFGLAFRNGDLYVGETHQVIRLSGSGFTQETVIVRGLPTGGHWTREIEFGPDGRLYVSVGSSCNLCEEGDARRAAIVRYAADGSGEEIVAVGLRNAVGLAFHSESGDLWASQNERDNLGNDRPAEELNVFTPGGAVEDFGWPYCYGNRLPNPEYRDAGRCAGTVAPSLEMQAHSAPLGMVFYDGDQFPAEYRGDLFLAFHGSWNRAEPTGYKVVRVRVQNGQPVSYEDFATGWLTDAGRVLGRPVAVEVGLDGSLYVSDDGSGRIWRIRWVG